MNLTEINWGWIMSLITSLNVYNFLKIETHRVNHFRVQKKSSYCQLPKVGLFSKWKATYKELNFWEMKLSKITLKDP